MPTELFTWYWFFSVIVVGILINLASAYMKPPIDRIMGRYSEKWRKRVLAKRKTYGTEIDLLLNDPSMIVLAVFRESQAEKRGFFCLIMATVFMVLIEISDQNISTAQHITGIVLVSFAVLASFYFMVRAFQLDMLIAKIYVIGREQGLEEVKKQQEKEQTDLPA